MTSASTSVPVMEPSRCRASLRSVAMQSSSVCSPACASASRASRASPSLPSRQPIQLVKRFFDKLVQSPAIAYRVCSRQTYRAVSAAYRQKIILRLKIRKLGILNSFVSRKSLVFLCFIAVQFNSPFFPCRFG